jgi:hypothetical protein
MKRKKIILMLIVLGVMAIVLITLKNCSSTRSNAAQLKNETMISERTKADDTRKPDIKEKKAKIETLDEIKDIYGRVEILSLYDGRSFMGVTISRGEKIEFKTVSGTFYFEAQTVRDTRIIK